MSAVQRGGTAGGTDSNTEGLEDISYAVASNPDCQRGSLWSSSKLHTYVSDVRLCTTADSGTSVRFLQILVALGQCKNFHGSDQMLWRRIIKSEYRKCAVMEVYESIKQMLLRIISQDSDEYKIMTSLIAEIDASLSTGTFTKKFQLSALPEIHSRIVSLVSNLMQYQHTESESDEKRVTSVAETPYVCRVTILALS